MVVALGTLKIDREAGITMQTRFRYMDKRHMIYFQNQNFACSSSSLDSLKLPGNREYNNGFCQGLYLCRWSNCSLFVLFRSEGNPSICLATSAYDGLLGGTSLPVDLPLGVQVQ